MITLFLLSKEIAKTTKQIAYFSYHLERCKRQSDKQKLVIKIVFLTIYDATLISAINKYCQEAIDNLCKPTDRPDRMTGKPNLLLLVERCPL